MSLISGYGKHLLDLIDANPVTPGQTRPEYDGHLASSAIMTECEEALSKWTSSASPLTAELSPAAQALSLQTRSQHQTEGDVNGLAFPEDYYPDGEEWLDPEHGLEGEFSGLELGESDEGERFGDNDHPSLHNTDENQVPDNNDYHNQHEQTTREPDRHHRLASPA